MKSWGKSEKSGKHIETYQNQHETCKTHKSPSKHWWIEDFLSLSSGIIDFLNFSRTNMDILYSSSVIADFLNVSSGILDLLNFS